MLLRNKTAVIYAAAGGTGRAISHAFAREGAHVFLTGRSRTRLEPLAREIAAAGGRAAWAEVDALDEPAIESHLDRVLAETGAVDISYNAIGLPQPGLQGRPLFELPVENFLLPVTTYARSHFLTARAAVRRMLPRRSGVILLHTPEPARSGAPLVGGMGLAWAGLEALTRDLAAEYGASGVRPVCLRTTGLPETDTIATVYGLHAASAGVTREQFQSLMESMTHHKRSTTLAELAAAAVFAASDLGSGFVGTVMNLTAGKSAD
jgi:NAD(P)-dependent dehydrogenase (short-subunit alcohol dehydrogenase family)